MQSRRRSRLPARATSQPLVHPMPQRTHPVGGQQRAAQRQRRHGDPRPHRHRPRTPRDTPSRPRRRPATRAPRVQRLRVAAGPCPRTGPDTASASPISSVSTDSAVRAGHGGSSSDASPAPATPVITASSRAPPSSRTSSGWRSVPPRSRRMSKVCSRLRSRPCSRCRTPRRPRRSTRFPNVTSDRSTDNATEASTTTTTTTATLATTPNRCAASRPDSASRECSSAAPVPPGTPHRPRRGSWRGR